MFFASNICWVSSGTVKARYCWDPGGQWSKTSHEEVETREWDQVDSQFSEVGVQLTWESEAASDTRHSSRDQVVEVTVSWGGQLQGWEANIVPQHGKNSNDNDLQQELVFFAFSQKLICPR